MFYESKNKNIQKTKKTNRTQKYKTKKKTKNKKTQIKKENFFKKLTFDIILTASSSIVNSTTGFAVSAIFRNTTLRPTTKIKNTCFCVLLFFSFCFKKIFFSTVL
jgi:Na+/melibiose symporter-like transporter